MKVSSLSLNALFDTLRRGELLLDVSPFVTRVRSDIPSLARDIQSMYCDFHIWPPDCFADFSLQIAFEPGLRRWYKPLARFFFDGLPSFTPLPAEQAFPMFEWGLNWCVAAHAHQYLVFHAAVIERHGRAVMMPAPPGSGKSTLCAGLAMRGWRLLSDELALYDMDTGLVFGMARPINLKNASIDAIRSFAPDVTMTPPVSDTSKGTVSLLRPSRDSVTRLGEAGRPAWVVLPTYHPGASPALSLYSKERAFMVLAEQSFNYHIHGVRGFEGVSRLIDDCQCFSFTYGRLEDAVKIFDELAESGQP